MSFSGSTATATSAGYTATAATGTDYWVATFNGDSNNNTVTSGTTDEPVSTSTRRSAPASRRPRRRGQSVADTATVTGLVDAAARTRSPSTCTAATTQDSTTLLYTDTETVSFSGSTATATSAGYTATARRARTTGWPPSTATATIPRSPAAPPTSRCNVDTDHHQPAAGHRDRRLLDRRHGDRHRPGSPGPRRYGDLQPVQLAPRVQNSTTLLFGPDTETIMPGSGGAYTATSQGYTTKAVGTEYWVATFNPDSDNSNASVASGAMAEPVTISKASPKITTS